MSQDLNIEQARARRTRRARWTVLGLLLCYFPVFVTLSRWVPTLTTPVWYTWCVAMFVGWFRALDIRFPRKNFQVREPDRSPRKPGLNKPLQQTAAPRRDL